MLPFKKIAVLAVVICAVAAVYFYSEKSLFEKLKVESERIVAIGKEKGPEAAIKEMEKSMNRYKVGYDFCHQITSILGKKAGEQANNFSEAVAYPDAILGSCTGGYIHGAAEGYLKKSANLDADTRSICETFIVNNRVGWVETCVHGVGHGVMAATKNDLPKALQICEHSFKAVVLKERCADGVYMENFDAGHHPGDGPASPYMKDEDSFYPCNQQTLYKDRCYLHTAEHYLLHNRKDNEQPDYEGVLALCATAEKGFEKYCFFNAGKRIIQNNTQHPRFAEQLCEQAPAEFVGDCIRGAASGFHEFFTPGRGKEFCTKILKAENVEFCPAVFK